MTHSCKEFVQRGFGPWILFCVGHERLQTGDDQGPPETLPRRSSGPVGEEHMFFAAQNSKACGLTRLGKYYWRLVSERKL